MAEFPLDPDGWDVPPVTGHTPLTDDVLDRLMERLSHGGGLAAPEAHGLIADLRARRAEVEKLSAWVGIWSTRAAGAEAEVERLRKKSHCPNCGAEL